MAQLDTTTPSLTCVLADSLNAPVARHGTIGAAPDAGAREPTASCGLAAEEVDQLAPLPVGQTSERLRMRDPTLGEDAAGSDRANLRE